MRIPRPPTPAGIFRIGARHPPIPSCSVALVDPRDDRPHRVDREGGAGIIRGAAGLPFQIQGDGSGGPVSVTMSPGVALDRISGTLLGTALGDALGLPAEGMSARAIARRFGRVDRFRLLGRTGFVSDDTEQAALVAQSLARHPDDVDRCVRAFRRSLLGWFCRLPWGVGSGDRPLLHPHRPRASPPAGSCRPATGPP